MANVDVVAVLRMVRQHIELCAPDDEVSGRLDVARDAVAELIAADVEYDSARLALDQAERDSYVAAKWKVSDAKKRRAAALAACKPEASNG